MKNNPTNTKAVYACYISGLFNAFFPSEEEAIRYCKNSQNAVEFNGTVFAPRYQAFAPGQLSLERAGKEVPWAGLTQPYRADWRDEW